MEALTMGPLYLIGPIRTAYSDLPIASVQQEDPIEQQLTVTVLHEKTGKIVTVSCFIYYPVIFGLSGLTVNYSRVIMESTSVKGDYI